MYFIAFVLFGVFFFFLVVVVVVNIHRSGVLTELACLVPHETAAISARSVYTIQP